MKIQLPRIKISLNSTVKTIFAILFVTVALIILTPQVDYQKWYPQGFGIHDYKLGVEFAEHKVATVQAQAPADLLDAIYSRSKIQGNDDLFVEATKDGLKVHVPSTMEDSLINNLLGNGQIQFYKPNDPAAIQSDPSLMFDLNNYQLVEIDFSKIYEAKVTSAKDPYAYISIRAEKAELAKLNTLATELNSGNLAIMIDGNFNLGWLLPAQGTSKYPTLVVLTDIDNAKIIAAELMATPLNELALQKTITTISAVYPRSTLYYFVATVGLVILLGLLYRIFYRKERLSTISATAIMILGILTVTKIITFTLTVPALVALMLFISTILVFDTKHYLLISILVLIVGILTGQIGGISAHSISIVLTTSAIFSTIYYSLLFLLGHYEED